MREVRPGLESRTELRTLRRSGFGNHRYRSELAWLLTEDSERLGALGTVGIRDRLSFDKCPGSQIE